MRISSTQIIWGPNLQTRSAFYPLVGLTDGEDKSEDRNGRWRRCTDKTMDEDESMEKANIRRRRQTKRITTAKTDGWRRRMLNMLSPQFTLYC